MQVFTVSQAVFISLPMFVDDLPMHTGLEGSAIITFKRRDLSVGQWTGVVDNVLGNINYDALPADINMDGDWLLQPWVTLTNGQRIAGSTIVMTVLPALTLYKGGAEC